MRTKIHLQVRTEKNEIKGSFAFDFQSEGDLDETMKRILPMLLTRGIGECEMMEYDFTLSGVVFEKGAKLKRINPMPSVPVRKSGDCH